MRGRRQEIRRRTTKGVQYAGRATVQQRVRDIFRECDREQEARVSARRERATLGGLARHALWPLLALGMSPVAMSAAADGVPEVRLLLPYAISGPREIQGADRTTRAYRAIAAHSVPPITELIADHVAQGVGGRGEIRVLRERTSRLVSAKARALLSAMGAAAVSLVITDAEAMLIEPAVQGMNAWRPAEILTLVSPIAIMPFALLCHPNACQRGSAASLVIKARTGGLRFGSAGETSLGHLAGEMLRRSLKVDALHVPYHGGHAALGATVGGQVDWMFAALPLALPHFGNDKLLGLALTSRSRFPLLPQVPTLEELKLEPAVHESWFAVFAGKQAAADRVSEVRTRLDAYGKGGGVRTSLFLRGLVPADESIAAFGHRMASDAAKWKRVLESSR